MSVRNRSLPALASALLAGLVVAGLGACADDEPARDDATNEITEAGEADVFTMQVGDCLTDESVVGEVSEVPVVPCAEPHASQIFHSHIIDGDVLPTATEMEAIVQEQCLPAFEGFVGLPYEQSTLELTWLEPTSGSWAEGDRELLCIVADPSGGVTGTLENAAR